MRYNAWHDFIASRPAVITRPEPAEPPEREIKRPDLDYDEATITELGPRVALTMLFENECSIVGRLDEIASRAGMALIFEDLARIDVARKVS